jgi:hypothetical protein
MSHADHSCPKEKSRDSEPSQNYLKAQLHFILHLRLQPSPSGLTNFVWKFMNWGGGGVLYNTCTHSHILYRESFFPVTPYETPTTTDKFALFDFGE